MDRDSFKRYIKIKSLLKVDFKGYSIDKIVALDLIMLVYSGVNFSFKSCLFAFVRLDFSMIKELPLAKVLSTMGRYNRRKDYYEIFEFINNKLGDVYPVDLNDCKYSICFSGYNIVKAYRLIFKTPLPYLTTKEKLFLFVRVVHYYNCINALEKFSLETKYESYLAFSSVHPYEAIFTLYFQKRKVPTYSLQHGLYFIFQRDIPIDALAYENFISDFHFCWGAYTRDEFVSYGIAADRLLIGGYPRKAHFVRKSSPIKCSRCIIFLARHKYAESNFKLINMLEEYKKKNRDDNVQLYFKLHPTLDASLYEEKVKDVGVILMDNLTLTELLQSDKFDFSLAINTAAYYESYIYGVPSLRFSDDSFENGIGVRDDIFTSVEELSMQIKNLRQMDNLAIYNNEVEQKLDYIIGLNISNYPVIFNNTIVDLG
ncbi:hypothetical protein PV783_01415 [Chitinophaga sp. CC14]|uniref:hypothetical protein n=1 Tax=Chitinophaga sp. CC14 TaxID=3029199 RepID=UPI003B7C761C